MTLEQACPSEYQGAQYAFKDSMTHGFCNSHYLSHFAAFFIDARTKRSVVESFILIKCFVLQTTHVKQEFVKWRSTSAGQRFKTPGGPYISRDGPAEATSGKIYKGFEVRPIRP